MSTAKEGKTVRVVLCETGCGKPATMFRKTGRVIVCSQCAERFMAKGFEKITPGEKSLAELLGIKEADFTEQELAEVIANAQVPELADVTA